MLCEAAHQTSRPDHPLPPAVLRPENLGTSKALSRPPTRASWPPPRATIAPPAAKVKRLREGERGAMTLDGALEKTPGTAKARTKPGGRRTRTRPSGDEDDLADVLAILDVRVGGRCIGEAKGTIDMRADLAFAVPREDLIEPSREHL